MVKHRHLGKVPTYSDAAAATVENYFWNPWKLYFLHVHVHTAHFCRESDSDDHMPPCCHLVHVQLLINSVWQPVLKFEFCNLSKLEHMLVSLMNTRFQNHLHVEGLLSPKQNILWMCTSTAHWNWRISFLNQFKSNQQPTIHICCSGDGQKTRDLVQSPWKGI